MAWQTLDSLPSDELWRGTRFLVSDADGRPVELLLIELPEVGGLGLLVDTGYKAGLHAGTFPPEAFSPGNVRAVSAAWIVLNWNEFAVYSSATTELLVDTQERQPVSPPRARTP